MYGAFSRAVGIDLSEVELPLYEYPSLSSFFARKLQPGARPLGDGEDDEILAPCDGRVGAMGEVREGTLLQAKGRHYSLEALVASRDLAERLEGGVQLTLYLSPADYHRVHCPLEANLVAYSYIPGVLLPVGPFFAGRVEDLFARNERLVLELETEVGPAALVLVGALGVGNLHLATPALETRRFRRQRLARHVTLERPMAIERGQELGAFQLGSTVVLVFPEKAMRFEPMEIGDRLRFGQRIGAGQRGDKTGWMAR